MAGPCAAAVLLHARPRAPRRRQDQLHPGVRRTVRRATEDRRAAALGGHPLAPPDVIADEPRAVDARRRHRDIGRRDRRGPRTVGKRLGHHPRLGGRNTAAAKHSDTSVNARSEFPYRGPIVARQSRAWCDSRARHPPAIPGASRAGRGRPAFTVHRPEGRAMPFETRSASAVPFSFELYPPRSGGERGAAPLDDRPAGGCRCPVHLRHLRRRRLHRRPVARRCCGTSASTRPSSRWPT